MAQKCQCMMMCMCGLLWSVVRIPGCFEGAYSGNGFHGVGGLIDVEIYNPFSPSACAFLMTTYGCIYCLVRW